MTRKSKPAGRCWQLVGAQLAITAVVIVAWIAGFALGHPVTPFVLALVAVIILDNLMLVATELREFAPPWDARFDPWSGRLQTTANAPSGQ